MTLETYVENKIKIFHSLVVHLVLRRLPLIVLVSSG